MNISSAAILAGVAADAWLLAFIAIRGRRPWLQATYAACSLAYIGLGAAFVGTNEGVLAALRNVIALIVAGPVYAYELEFLGEASLAGANLGSPIALACFALVAVQADPYPIAPRPSKGPTKPGRLPASDAIVFEEIRPKYALRTAHEESSGGRATLILGRTAPAMSASGTGFAAILPVRHASLRALTTASEFLGGSRGGLAVVEDLSDLSALSEWPPTIEAGGRLRHIARGTGATVNLFAA